MALEIVSKTHCYAKDGAKFVSVVFREIESGKTVRNNYFLKNAGVVPLFLADDPRWNQLKEARSDLEAKVHAFIFEGKVINRDGLDIVVFNGQDEEEAFLMQSWKLKS